MLHAGGTALPWTCWWFRINLCWKTVTKSTRAWIYNTIVLLLQRTTWACQTNIMPMLQTDSIWGKDKMAVKKKQPELQQFKIKGLNLSLLISIFLSTSIKNKFWLYIWVMCMPILSASKHWVSWRNIFPLSTHAVVGFAVVVLILDQKEGWKSRCHMLLFAYFFAPYKQEKKGYYNYWSRWCLSLMTWCHMMHFEQVLTAAWHLWLNCLV